MLPLEFLTQPFSLRLGSTLLHFVWQGFVLAAVMWLVLRFFRVRHAQHRYAVSLAGLLLMAVCPMATFAILGLWETGTHTPVDLAVAAEPMEHGGTFVAESMQDHGELPLVSRVNSQDASPREATLVLPQQLPLSFLPAVRPYFVLVWLGGVLLFSLRLLLGIAGIHWLRRGGRAIDAASQGRFDRLARRLGLSCARVSVSTRVSEALVVGFWRPLVLLPAAWLAELPPATLEAIVAHELAHLRRYDLWINLVQRFIETLLFYHPAVWWLSGRLRVERELCCDELAVAVTGRRVEYAAALELVARKRLVSPRPLLAAPIGGENAMTLLNRVRNILGLSPAPDRARLWPAGLLLLAAPVALWAASTGLLSSGQPQAAADEERKVEVKREGERRDDEREVRREGDRPVERKEGERREEERRPEVRREGERPVERKPEPRREEERPATGRAVPGGEGGELFRLIQQLREEVNALRAEVRDLRARGAVREGEIRRDGDRPRPDAPREGDRPRPDAPRRDGDRPKEGEVRRDGDRPRPDAPRDGDRPRPDAPRDGDKPKAVAPRRDGDRPKEGEIRRDGDRPKEGPRDGDREKPRTSGVIKGIGENNVVEISVGTIDGVKAGSLLAIVRGDKYLGRLLVVKVGDNGAIGEASLAGKDVELEIGDALIANLEGR